MSSPIIQFDQNARTSMLNGIQILTRAVKSTMGPRGQHAVISQPGDALVITRDGSDIARSIRVQDPSENAGIEVMRDIAVRVGNTSGDGTSAAIVVSHALIELGLQHIQGGGSSSDLAMGFDVALKTLLTDLSTQSNRINSEQEIRQIAAVASNRDKEITDLVVSAYKSVGMDGSLLVNESNTYESHMKVERTFTINRVYEPGVFNAADGSRLDKLDNSYVLLTDEPLTSIRDLTGMIEAVTKTGRSLLVIAPEYSNEVIEWFDQLNSKQEFQPLVLLSSPTFGNRQQAQLQDIAIFTGGLVLSEQIGLTVDKAGLGELGYAKTVFLEKDKTVLAEGAGRNNDILARIQQLRVQLQNADSEEEREFITDRMKNMSGGSAVIFVGDTSRDSLNQKMRRVRRVIAACDAAIAEGIVPGGGVAYIRLQGALKTLQGNHPEHSDACSIIRRALEAPLRYIAENADSDPDDVVRSVQNGQGGYGYNALTRSYEDLTAIGVYDPAKVVRSVIEHAIQYAGIVITTGVSISPRN